MTTSKARLTVYMRHPSELDDLREALRVLAPPVAVVCPKCGADCGTPRLATRRRRLVQVVAGGRVLSTEIE